MKILQYPAYISIPKDTDFARTITGYGLMTLEIACSISNVGINVDLLTVTGITGGKKYKSINILKRTWSDIVLNIRFCDIWKGIRLIVKDKLSFIKAIKVLFYFASIGYFRKIIRINKYDLIHFHGIDYSNFPLIEYCIKEKQKYLLTLHGLNSFSDSINISPTERQLEKTFLKKAINDDIPVTVISTGIKSTIYNFFKINHSKTFHIITNGCDLNSKSYVFGIDLRKKYKIIENVKIMLCIGNLCERKNQIQVIRAYSKLSKNIQRNLVLIFIGTDTTNGIIKSAICDLGLSNKIKLCGNIPKEEISTYYRQADFTILASISEGFGLSIIEGFSFGLPNLTFSDLDAIPDVYNENVMITVDNRTDVSLAEGMKKILEKEWDNDFIKVYAQKFSLEKMAKKYLEIYNKVLEQNNLKSEKV